MMALLTRGESRRTLVMLFHAFATLGCLSQRTRLRILRNFSSQLVAPTVTLSPPPPPPGLFPSHSCSRFNETDSGDIGEEEEEEEEAAGGTVD